MRPVSVSQERIDRVLALRDHALRNYWITRVYWELAETLRPSFGCNGTWLSFAVWASSSVAPLIPKDGALHVLAQADEPKERETLSLVKRALDAVGVGRWLDRISSSVSEETADGNRLVFAELAPLFLRLSETLGDRSRERRDALLGSTDRPLRDPMKWYIDAANARQQQPKRCAELVLLANLEVVLHEQRRLDGRIRKALDAFVLEGLRPLLRADGASAPLARLLRVPLGWARPCLNEITERIATDAFLTLRIHKERLSLARDLRKLYGDNLFPPDLQKIQDKKLEAFLDRWDQTQQGNDPAAENWADLGDRMNFICTLFRSRQQQDELFARPFESQPVARA